MKNGPVPFRKEVHLGGKKRALISGEEFTNKREARKRFFVG